MKTGVEDDIFSSYIGSGFEEPGGTLPPKIPRSIPQVFVVDRKYPTNRPEVSRHPVAEDVSRQGRSWRRGAKGGCTRMLLALFVADEG